MKSYGVFTFPYFLLIALNVLLFIIAYYVLVGIQVPLWYNRGKMISFGLSLVASSFFLYALWRITGEYWLDDLVYRTYDPPFMTLGDYLLETVQNYTPPMALLAWETDLKRRKELELAQQLEQEKLENELKFLKAQINPHFLFNTLNNLYSFVVNKSPQAPEMVLKFSGVLDYLLYKSQRETVPLKEEIKTIDNFCGLEKSRYGDRLEVEYKTEGNLSVPVSPLILLSIVENAFKHGASGDIDQPKIKINIKEKDKFIFCNVWNTKSSYNGELNDSYKKGIGLANIKRQLHLLYPNNHQLILEDKEASFNVSLTITPKA